VKIFNKTLSAIGILLAFQTPAALAQVRDITFESFLIDTGIANTELYNNGRMRKPVQIKYSAYLHKPDASWDDKVYVKLTRQEEMFYLRLGEFGETYPQDIRETYPNFSMAWDPNKYDMDIHSNTKEFPIERDAHYNTALIYLSYNGDDKDDVLGTKSLCVFANPERAEIDGYPGGNCATDRGDKRQIQVISGAYASYVAQDPTSTNVIRAQVINEDICTSTSECEKFAARPDADGHKYTHMRHIGSFETEFSTTRPNHYLQPIDHINRPWVWQPLGGGCRVSQDVDNYEDFYCTWTHGYDMYFTGQLFGSQSEFDSLTLYYRGWEDRQHAESWKKYDFVSNRNREGKYSVIGAVGTLERTASKYGSLDMGVAHDWDQKNKKIAVDQTMEDNYGNQFRLTADFKEDDLQGDGKKKQYYQLDQSSIEITPIYK